MDELKIFIQNVKNLMKNNDIKTGKELAEKTGFSQPFVSRILRGDGKPSFDFIVALTYTFKTTIKDLFTPDNEQFKPLVKKPVCNEDIAIQNMEAIKRLTQDQQANKTVEEHKEKTTESNVIRLEVGDNKHVLVASGKRLDVKAITINAITRHACVELKPDEIVSMKEVA